MLKSINHHSKTILLSKLVSKNSLIKLKNAKRIFFVTMESDMVWNLLCWPNKKKYLVSSRETYSENW